MSWEPVGDLVPRSGNALTRALGRVLLGWMGWRLGDPFPNVPKAVAVVAPHTSNWDWVVGTLASFAIGLRTRYLAKHTLFVGPLGWLLRRLGGIPLNRKAADGVVEQMVAEFERADQLVLGITPEGTRKPVRSWRSGFYFMAHGAGVPIVPAYMDWPSRTIGFGPPFFPTGDRRADMKSLRQFFRPYRGKFPHTPSAGPDGSESGAGVNPPV